MYSMPPFQLLHLMKGGIFGDKIKRISSYNLTLCNEGDAMTK